nr:midasin isoform X4 [Ipomoea batatas]
MGILRRRSFPGNKKHQQLHSQRRTQGGSEKGWTAELEHIEMEEDFAADDTYNISEDSVDDGDGNEENEQVESDVGETGNHSEKVDEKLWDREEEENNDSVDE